MTEVPGWIQQMTQDVIGPAPVQVGRQYAHPTDGVIEITSGQYWGTHGLSNFWHWRVMSTGEMKHGYGEEWPEVVPVEMNDDKGETNDAQDDE